MQKGKNNELTRNITDIHEVLAEFGTQEAGVFPKDKLDAAIKVQNYAYNELTYEDRIAIERGIKEMPVMYNYSVTNKAPYNPFRCVGVKVDIVC